MDIRPTLKILSKLLLLLCVAMGIVMIYAYFQHGGRELYALFRNCALGTLLAGILLGLVSRRHRRENRLALGGVRESYIIVVLSWIMAISIAAVPFYYGANMRFSDALFEAASGLTTTGATVITPELVLRDGQTLSEYFPEYASDASMLPLPPVFLLWRSILNWLGGCGIIFFVLMVVPFSTFGKGVLLYNAEVPGLKNDERVVTSLKDSIYSVAALYCVLTFFAMILFRMGGMTGLDSICHALTSVSTGGFSTRTASMGYYNTPFLQWIVICFMMLSACNFSQLLKFFIHRDGALFRDEEFRIFIGVFLVALIFITTTVYLCNPDGLPVTGGTGILPRSIEGYLRTVAFQLATIMSTTGFVTSDYELWHVPAALLILIAVMFPCGCGGSTAGGMKFSRVVVVSKHFASEVHHCIFPHSVWDIRFNGIHLDMSLVSKTLGFMMLYIAMWGVVSFLLLLLEGPGIDINTACGASICTLSNIGPGLGKVGATGNFSWMCGASKYLLTLTMITGRLELYTILVMFSPSFWKK